MPENITIDSMGGLGDGIATWEGKPLFISKSAVGDVLDVRIVHETKEALRGEIISVVTPGPQRVAPPCPHFSACGGCSMQQLSENAYREFKRRMFHGALRQAGLSSEGDVTFLPAASRRRVELKLHRGPKGVTFAYYAARSRDLVPVDNCLILEPLLQALLTPLARTLGDLPFVGEIPSLDVTAADSGIDLVLNFKGDARQEWPPLQEIAANLGLARVSARMPDGRRRTLIEYRPVEMTLGGYAVSLPPDAFLQASREGQMFLTRAVTEALKGSRAVADLFCGIGTYSFPLSRSAQVHAVESDPAMVETLERMIKRHGLSAALTFERRDLFKNPLGVTELSRFDAVVINPPRPGAKAQCEQLAASPVKTVAMVSCNAASFARDAKILVNGGFSLTHAAAIDQFVYSPHLEIIAVFERG